MASIFPLVVLAGYIWDVKKKIILSPQGIKLCYGCNIVEMLNTENQQKAVVIPPPSGMA